MCVKPRTDGAGGQHRITTWPANRGALKELVTQFYQTIPERIKEDLEHRAYLQGKLGKEERKLVKVMQCSLDDVLTLWDRHLDILPANGLVRQHQAMGNILERVHLWIAKLGRMEDYFYLPLDILPQPVPVQPELRFIKIIFLPSTFRNLDDYADDNLCFIILMCILEVKKL